MWLEVAASYGVYCAVRDFGKWLASRNFKREEKRAAKQYNLVPVKGNPGLYKDQETGYETRMEYDNGEFFPSSVTDFEIAIRGRHYDFRR